MQEQVNKEQQQRLKELLRQQHIKDSDQVASKQRYGFFNLSVPLAVGDDSYDQNKTNANNKIKLEKPNISVAPLQSGKNKSSYFSQLGFTTIGDKYLDPQKVQFHYEKHQYGKISKEQPNFKSTSFKPSVIKPPYEYKSDAQTEVKKNYREEATGKVIVENRNVFVSPNVYKYNLHYPHYQDEYERFRQQKIKEQELNKQILKNKPPFAVGKGGQTFDTNQKIYKINYDLLQQNKEDSTSKETSKEEKKAPFLYSNPPKKGYNKTIGKNPEYISDPIKERVRQVKTQSKQAFKLERQAMEKSKAIVSIALHSINLRSLNNSCF